MRPLTILAAALLCGTAPCAMAAYALQPYHVIPIGSWPDAVATGDIDGDGLDDIVITTGSYFDDENDQGIFVFLQQPDGSLAAPLKFHYVYAQRNGIAMADLDGDGRMEVVVGQGYGITVLDWTPSTHRRGPIRLESYGVPGPGSAAEDVAILDVDRDGFLDVFAQSWSSGATIYFGDGRGGFPRRVNVPTPVEGYNDLKSGDLNNDGHDDIAILSGQGWTDAYVYYNDGSDDMSPPIVLNPWPGGFTPMGSLAIGDFNDDGRQDLVIMRNEVSLSLFLQDDTGDLLPEQVVPTGWHPNAMIARDLDLDGRTDLTILRGGGSVGIHLQGANGLEPDTVFEGSYASSLSSQGLSVGDVNGDGCPDVVAANYVIGLMIWPGTGCPPVPDLAPDLQLSPSLVTLRLDNLGAATAAAPETTLTLEVSAGGLGVGALPPGCSLGQTSASSAEITCVTPALAAGASSLIGIPIVASGNSSRSTLHVVAGSVTGSIEPRTANNVASQSIRLMPVRGREHSLQTGMDSSRLPQSGTTANGSGTSRSTPSTRAIPSSLRSVVNSTHSGK